MNKKMAAIDIGSFGEHESRPEEPTEENIPLDPVTPVGGGSTWEPTSEQETSFRGRLTLLRGGRPSQRNRLLINRLKVYMRDCLKNWQEPQTYFTATCLNSEMESCTSETKASP